MAMPCTTTRGKHPSGQTPGQIQLNLLIVHFLAVILNFALIFPAEGSANGGDAYRYFLQKKLHSSWKKTFFDYKKNYKYLVVTLLIIFGIII